MGHIDHPGTPVQVSGAVMLRAVYMVGGSAEDGFQADVLKRPEYYLNAINGLLIILNALALLAIGFYTLRRTKRFCWALWLQLFPFLSPVLLEYGLTRVTPEPLLFFTSSLLVLLVVLAFPPAFVGEKKWFTPVALAAVTGFGIANKITFVPVVVLSLLILERMRPRLLYLGATAGFFVLFTLPIIRMYPRFFGWIFALFSHSGQYGSGPSDVIQIDKYISNIWKLLSGNPLFSILLITSIVFIVYTLFRPGWRKYALPNIYFRLLTAVTAAQGFGLVTVAKHSAHHYLLPVLNLSGVLVFLLYFCFRHLRESGCINTPAKILKPAVTGFVVLIVILSNPTGRASNMVRHLENHQEKGLALYTQVQKDYRGFGKVYYYRCSSPEYALKFGSDLSRSYHAETLEKTLSRCLVL